MAARRRAARSGVEGPLAIWAGTRVAVALLSFAAAWTLADATGRTWPSFLSRWNHWDVGLFVKIARWGYFGYPQHYTDRGVVAFFPGEPLVLRAVHVVVPDWVAAGLVISAVAGAVAMVALARLGALEGGAGTGERAVLYLALSPYAVFLFAGYSEALFLALALPSWLAARQGRWPAAGALGALAALVRVTGVFLGAALLVEFVVQRRRLGRDAAWTLGPWLGTAAYLGWLAWRTGDWLAWPHAQAAGWQRRLTDPWTALTTTWSAASNLDQGAAYVWSFRAEIASVLVGVVLTLVLLWLRRWAEATYVGLQVVALATSTFYLSVGRATLLWWPLWLLLAAAAQRARWVHVAYLSLAAPLMAVLVLTFNVGHWVG